MSKGKKIDEISDDLKKYREAAQSAINAHLIFLGKVAQEFANISNNYGPIVSDDLLKFSQTFYTDLKPDMDKCLLSINDYTRSLEKDYVEAIKKLTKIKEDL
ncbi:TPA: hypothetical protein ACS70J_000011 [Providencia alcalifaciens]